MLLKHLSFFVTAEDLYLLFLNKTFSLWLLHNHFYHVSTLSTQEYRRYTNVSLSLMSYLILLEGGLRLSIRSLALVVIPSNWRATSCGCHTRHRADLCNFVCLCSCLKKRNYSPLIEDEVPAFVSLKKLQFKNKTSCRDHCITYK